MGTRAQVFMKDKGVYLYQHWDGYALMQTVVNAVNGIGVGRQDDPEYLGRIIFSQMIRNDLDGETGFGIGNSQHEDIDYLVTVDCKAKTITEEKVRWGGTETVRIVPFKR